MERYAAFLRGINLGGRRVTNDRLVEIATGAGFEDVTAFLASGNLALRAAGMTAVRIEDVLADALRDGLGYEAAAFVRTADELAAVVAHDPFGVGAEGTVHVAFLRDEPSAATRQEISDAASAIDRVAFHGREMHWHVAGAFRDSALSGATVARILGDGWTVRTAGTVRRLRERMPESGDD